MSGGNDEADARTSIEDVLAKHASALLTYPNVTGVGIQEEARPMASPRKHIQVYVSKKLPRNDLAPSEIIPRQIEGVDVRVEEIGPIVVE